jgi:hypothetical protein
LSRYRPSFETVEQALVEALYLGLIAPGDDEAKACAVLAEGLAAGLPENVVEVCRAAAIERVHAESPS